MALALQHHRAGRLSEAEQLYHQILRLDDQHAESIHLLGMLHFQNGHLQMAEELIRRAIAINDQESLYHSNLGIVLQAANQPEQSILCYRRAVALNHNSVVAHYNLAVTLGSLGEHDEAMAEYERVLRLSPDHVDANVNLGVELFERGRISEAVAHYHHAIALRPQCAEAFCNLGNALAVQDNPNEAETCFLRAVALKWDYATAHGNLGSLLQEQNRFEEAMLHYRRYLLLKPDSADAWHSIALLQLLQGDYENGWTNYQHRWRVAGQAPAKSWPQPSWNGDSLSCGSVLLWPEQGVGDEIMFAGLIPDAIRTGNAFVLQCDSRLKPLFARSFPQVEVVASDEIPLSELSAQLPIGDLPRLFRSAPEAFAATTSPYLIPDPSVKCNFRTRYACKGMTVGLAWRTKNKISGRRRSIDLPRFAGLLRQPGISWVSLQYGDQDSLEKEIREANAPILLDRRVDQLTNLDAFAAQIAALDLVITIDNSTAHLAGALGVPVRVLLPFARDWRWLADGEHCPWYPSMRLFRQPVPGDWSSALTEVENRLARQLGADVPQKSESGSRS